MGEREPYEANLLRKSQPGEPRIGQWINAELHLDSAREPKPNRAQPSTHGVHSMGETAERLPPDCLSRADFRNLPFPQKLARNLDKLPP